MTSPTSPTYNWQPSGSSSYRMTKTCRHWARGDCWRGTDCTFLHEFTNGLTAEDFKFIPNANYHHGNTSNNSNTIIGPEGYDLKAPTLYTPQRKTSLNYHHRRGFSASATFPTSPDAPMGNFSYNPQPGNNNNPEVDGGDDVFLSSASPPQPEHTQDYAAATAKRIPVVPFYNKSRGNGPRRRFSAARADGREGTFNGYNTNSNNPCYKSSRNVDVEGKKLGVFRRATVGPRGGGKPYNFKRHDREEADGKGNNNNFYYNGNRRSSYSNGGSAYDRNEYYINRRDSIGAASPPEAYKQEMNKQKQEDDWNEFVSGGRGVGAYIPPHKQRELRGQAGPVENNYVDGGEYLGDGQLEDHDNMIAGYGNNRDDKNRATATDGTDNATTASAAKQYTMATPRRPSITTRTHSGIQRRRAYSHTISDYINTIMPKGGSENNNADKISPSKSEGPPLTQPFDSEDEHQDEEEEDSEEEEKWEKLRQDVEKLGIDKEKKNGGGGEGEKKVGEGK